MKKILVLLLVVLLLLSTAACGAKSDQGKQEETEPAKTEAEATQAVDEPIDGGWTDAQTTEITDEVKAMFDKINETMTGAYYVPIAYLESQVVAGTNHLVLCKEIPSVNSADALGIYAIVTVYENLEGNAEITAVEHSSVTAPQPYNPDNPTVGGWSEPVSFALSNEAKAAFAKAKEAKSNAYEPIALLATQVVAGTNYQILCKDASGYAILTVYEDLDGNAEISQIDVFTADEVNTGDNPDGVIDAESASSQAE